MKTLYLIGGPMGVGKTTVCQILKRELPDCVFLDGDWCWDADPFRVTEETKAMVMRNICAVLNNFLACSAYRNVVFCWVLHEQAILDEILAHMETNGVRVLCVSLLCPAQELVRRLQGDIDAGLRTEDVIDRSLARLPLYEALHTVKIDTAGKDAAKTAAEIMRAAAEQEDEHG